jgi:hypothetical protein
MRLWSYPRHVRTVPTDPYRGFAMPSQGTVVVISGVDQVTPSMGAAIPNLPDRIDTSWDDIHRLIETHPPAAIIALVEPATAARLDALAARVATLEPYVPLIAIGAEPPFAANVLPFAPGDDDSARLQGRLRAALRVRSLHGTVLRRFAGRPIPLPDADPLQDASVLLMGRGACFPALSVALGTRLGVVGALSVDVAAKHLNVREVDGIVIGEGFTRRVVEGFLGVLGDDPRFRNLPVLVLPAVMDADARHALPYLEFAPGEPNDVAERAAPLLRLHALEARLIRMLKVIEANGMLDPHTGLLTTAAFGRDLSAAIGEAVTGKTTLSLVRFALEDSRRREQVDAARIVGRLMRRTDFATLCGDGTIIMAFTGTDGSNVQPIARRLANVLRYSVLSSTPDRQTEVQVATTTLQPNDSAASLMARVRIDSGGERAAS